MWYFIEGRNRFLENLDCPQQNLYNFLFHVCICFVLHCIDYYCLNSLLVNVINEIVLYSLFHIHINHQFWYIMIVLSSSYLILSEMEFLDYYISYHQFIYLVWNSLYSSQNKRDEWSHSLIDRDLKKSRQIFIWQWKG